MSDPETRVEVNTDEPMRWFVNGRYHREDGPAIEDGNGSKWWYFDGKVHREDGPAFEGYDGSKFWCLNGKEVSWQDVFRQAKTQEIQLRILIAALTTS